MTTPDLRERHGKSLRFIFSRVPFVSQLGLELVSWDTPDLVVVRMPFSPAVENGFGTPHGGAVASLLDTAGSAAVWNGHDYEKGSRGSTTSMTVNYTGAAREEAVLATARCVARTKELNFAEINAISETSGRPIASGVLTYRIVP